MSLESKDEQIKELERIIDFIKNAIDIDFCNREYGDCSYCEECITENQDEGCIACKMIYVYRNKYKQTKG